MDCPKDATQEILKRKYHGSSFRQQLWKSETQQATELFGVLLKESKAKVDFKLVWS
jgi:hypothetical protein